MTKHARFVLTDTKHALSKHGKHLHGEAFRTSWFGIIALLRSVGHVLDKVDSESSKAMRGAIKKNWANLQKSKPEPAIFWGFIEEERNRFLKNYEHGISRARIFFSTSGDSPLAVDIGYSQSGFSQVVGIKGLAPSVKHGDIVSVLSSGPFAGIEERLVAQQAIE